MADDMADSYNFTPLTYKYHNQTVPQRMKHFSKTRGDKVVYIFRSPDGQRVTVSAKELYEKAMALAVSLVKIGVTKGDVVATCLPNDLDSLVSTLGVICSGGIIANLLITRADGSDVRGHLQRLRVKCLIINPGEKDREVNSCMTFIDSVNKTGTVGSKDVPSLKSFIVTRAVEGHEFLLLDNLLVKSTEQTALPRLDSEDTCVYHLTSGSTGESKYVPQSHHTVMIIGHQTKEMIRYDDDDIVYNERRMAWIGGFPYMYLHDAATLVAKTMPLLTLAEHCEFTYQVLVSEKCTVACFLPATIVGMLDCIAMKPVSKPLLKVINTGGLPVASVCMDSIGTLTDSVTNGYGSSEAAFVSVDIITNKADFVNYCAGIPLSGVEIKVVDNDGFVVKRGEVGQIHVRSPSLFRYYLENEEKTKEVLSPNHWMDTDDVGYMMRDGKIVVSGRVSDLIFQGGQYHVATEIEAHIKTHPDVLDVLVISIPDDALFELVCACVLPKPGATITADVISKFYDKTILPSADEAFSRFRPEVIEIFDSYPKVYTGKPDKRALKQIVMERRAKIDKITT